MRCSEVTFESDSDEVPARWNAGEEDAASTIEEGGDGDEVSSEALKVLMKGAAEARRGEEK